MALLGLLNNAGQTQRLPQTMPHQENTVAKLPGKARVTKFSPTRMGTRQAFARPSGTNTGLTRPKPRLNALPKAVRNVAVGA